MSHPGPYLFPVASLSGHAPSGAWDEMTGTTGKVRPLWSGLARAMEHWTAEERATLSESADHLLEDLGATYNIYSDAGGSGRPWRIDPLPLLIDAQEWNKVATGLGQRMRLLEMVLTDLYGPQKLLEEGLVPPDLVHANPHFLTNLRGIVPVGGRYLATVGFDLIRGDDGRWRILRDHTRLPGGLGQTLENRSVTTNVLQAEFETSRVAGITPFFELEREMLLSMSHERTQVPHMVLLTPGFRHPSYFEHAYKARVLGIPLVEPADLTVRERRLFLKTLSGLRRVDVLVCRLDDDSVDPLEFWTMGGGGVPGLAEVWRSGNVALANAPGTGFAATMALMPFLPGICRKWLGEDLKLPFVETWWLGQTPIREKVLADLQRYIIFPAFGPGQPVRCSSLGSNGRKLWLATLESRPHDFVVQRDITPSLAPVLDKGSFHSQPVIWRSFCLQSTDGPVTLRGGLGIVAKDGILLNEYSGAELTAKDVWVPDETSVTSEGPAIRLEGHQIARDPTGAEVPSRMAEHLFWVGRYAERIELATRLLRTTVKRLGGELTASRRAQRDACFALLRGLEILPPEATTLPPQPLPVLARLVHNPSAPHGLPSLIRPLLWNAASARDRLSDDTWRLFNRLEDLLHSDNSHPTASALVQTLDNLVLHLAAFAGMQAENMTRGHGWRFLEIGRRIERSLGVLSLLASAPDTGSPECPVLEPLLETCDSTMTYRRRHFSRPRWDSVAELLFSDPSNPRAAAAQARILSTQCETLPGDPQMGLLPRIREHVAALVQATSPSPDGIPDASGFVKRASAFEELSDLLTQHYFSHSVRRVY
ncbi:circularly permuted type 2 ATP-grasp protein [Luteolibacter ambystomatis]|uniref:Circularly permuted type 2 ATP-grasp protein n=1 Tax=Luteolibacter ambystomatis TaxID=2824561 RepID=A0A975J237_9BACT|nr:circularly permuted type 2 ATP-grasp protein [Luteolibacter ambystomatis]QUE52564.1 circularly permuted type 2 ATP-grasp protein [Luteolibacter ambystomatis]